MLHRRRLTFITSLFSGLPLLAACATTESLDAFGVTEPGSGGDAGSAGTPMAPSVPGTGGFGTGGVAGAGGAPTTGGTPSDPGTCQPGFVSQGGICIPEGTGGLGGSDADGGGMGGAGGAGGGGGAGGACEPSCEGRCGVIPDLCGGELDCEMASCTNEEVCDPEGRCCTPMTCDDPSLAGQCGDLDDGCGGTITCGTQCPVFRVNTYTTSSSGYTWNVTLNQPLARNYFATVRGTRGTNDNPNSDYVRIVQDPHGTGALGNGDVNNSQIRLNRDNNASTWVGVVTVVECLHDCGVNGFELLDVRVLVPSGTSGSITAGTGWDSDIDRVMIMGGIFGPGVTTDSTAMGNRGRKFFHFVPSGTNSIDWTRPDSGGTVRATVMVLRWGTAWTVQRRTVTGTSFESTGGLTAYDTAAIAPVPRANTWVWGTGRTQGTGHGNSTEGSIVTLGTGGTDVSNADESSAVAVGQQANPGNKVFEVYALTHPDLVVDHRHRPNGTSGTTADVTTNDASGCPGARAAVNYTGSASTTTGNDWKGSVWTSRYSSNTNIHMSRNHNDSINWSGWIQGIQFCNIISD
jgi:hypothetical protein